MKQIIQFGSNGKNDLDSVLVYIIQSKIFEFGFDFSQSDKPNYANVPY